MGSVGYNMGRDHYRAVDEAMAERAEPRLLVSLPPEKKEARQTAARTRLGNARQRDLVRRYKRKEFGKRELHRRTVQLWASI